MPTKLGKSISQSRIPDSEARRLQTVRLARELAASARGRRRRLAGISAAVAVVLGGLAISSAGQAAVEAVEDLVGIGEPPADTVPIVGTTEAGVVATGTTPSGTEFEVVLALLDERESRGQGSVGCLYVSYPAPDLTPGSASCLTRAALRGLADPGSMQVFPSVQRTGPVPELSLLVTATAGSNIVEGTLAVEGENATEVEMTAVGFDAPNANRENAEGSVREVVRVTHMVGFLPIGVLGPVDLTDKPSGSDGPGYPEVAEAVKRIRVRGYDEQGELVSEKRIDASPFTALRLSESMFEQAQPDTPRELAERLCVNLLADRGALPVDATASPDARGQLRRFGRRLDACVAEQLAGR